MFNSSESCLYSNKSPVRFRTAVVMHDGIASSTKAWLPAERQPDYSPSDGGDPATKPHMEGVDWLPASGLAHSDMCALKPFA